VALFNGALLNRENDYVEVPNLVGAMYSEGLLSQYKDLDVILQPQEYSDKFQKGQIMHQKPSGGEKVAKGTELRITVSMGAEPKVKVMQDLVTVTKDEADSYLKGQGFYPLFRNEPSALVEAGCVTRTDPFKGVELEEGQTIIVWISTGPDVILQKMPDVMGLDLESAKKILNGLGFENIRFREVESGKPKGTVVYQSQEKGTELDVTIDIFLEISQGPDETLPPVTRPAQDEESPEDAEPVTQDVTFNLPAREEAYVLSIQLNDKEVVEAQEIQPGVDSFTATLTNSGKRYYDLYIDGEYYRTQEVMFSNG
jgi:serine/threonine-protein kinase